MTEILDYTFKRRSIRSYTERAVEQEKLVDLLKAGMAAPSACSSRPWEFVVVTDPEIMAVVREKLRFGQYNAPAAICVCANLKIANNSAAKHYWVQDCSAAVENILIAASGMGLGTVWLGVYPLEPFMRTVRSLFGIPDEVIPLCVIYVGYPAEEKPSRTNYDAHRVYWQQYEPRKRKAKIKNAKYNSG
jgi:nitroreductase